MISVGRVPGGTVMLMIQFSVGNVKYGMEKFKRLHSAWKSRKCLPRQSGSPQTQRFCSNGPRLISMKPNIFLVFLKKLSLQRNTNSTIKHIRSVLNLSYMFQNPF